MSAYLPTEPGVASIGLALLAATLGLGFAITRFGSRPRARVAAWALVAAAVVGAERLTAGQPPGFRMLGLVGVLLYAMKAVVCVEGGASRESGLGWARWWGFAIAWPGMRPDPFATAGRRRVPGGPALMARGLGWLVAGAALVLLARAVWRSGGSLALATALVLPGLSLILHFGIFNLLAGAWRLAGVNVGPLFRAPVRSRSLTEFWGRRWNLAFSEMTAIGIYRPLAPRLGRPAATAVAFIGSGLLHELAISVPVKAGFGLPSLYFALQGALMLIERALERAGSPVHRTAWIGRLWTLAWLVLPLPILFHRPFLAGVVWPLLGPGR